MIKSKTYWKKNETLESIVKRMHEDGDVACQCPNCKRFYRDNNYSEAIGICPFCSFDNGIILKRY